MVNIDVDNIDKLKDLDIWLIWKSTPEGHKIPSNPTTGKWGLKWKDSDNLITYSEAMEAKVKHNAGIGFVLPPGYCLIDIDDVNADDPNVIKLLKYFDSYAELSVSGKGIHIIIAHDLSDIKNFAYKTEAGISIEVKPHTYSTFTGNVIYPSIINDVTDLLKFEYYKYNCERMKDIKHGCYLNDIKPVSSPTAYFKAALQHECDKVRRACTGRRTNTLFGAASKLGRFREHLDQVRSELETAGTSTGLSKEKIRRTIESGFRYSK